MRSKSYLPHAPAPAGKSRNQSSVEPVVTDKVESLADSTGRRLAGLLTAIAGSPAESQRTLALARPDAWQRADRDLEW